MIELVKNERHLPGVFRSSASDCKLSSALRCAALCAQDPQMAGRIPSNSKNSCAEMNLGVLGGHCIGAGPKRARDLTTRHLPALRLQVEDPQREHEHLCCANGPNWPRRITLCTERFAVLWRSPGPWRAKQIAVVSSANLLENMPPNLVWASA